LALALLLGRESTDNPSPNRRYPRLQNVSTTPEDSGELGRTPENETTTKNQQGLNDLEPEVARHQSLKKVDSYNSNSCLTASCPRVLVDLFRDGPYFQDVGWCLFFGAIDHASADIVG
jgi:hypothetical protein